jgi:hypothetical protein
MKKCRICNETDETKFSPSRTNQCKSCVQQYRKDKRAGTWTPAQVKGDRSKTDNHKTPEATWKRHIKAKFGINENAYHDLVESQGNRCGICRTDSPSSKHGKWSIDHCHSTGKIRGLLCQSCNKGLGLFRDNVAFLQQAVQYLNRG